MCKGHFFSSGQTFFLYYTQLQKYSQEILHGCPSSVVGWSKQASKLDAIIGPSPHLLFPFSFPTCSCLLYTQ